METPNQNADQSDLHTNAGDFFNEYTPGMLWDNLSETLVLLLTSDDFKVSSPTEQTELVQFIIRSHQLLHDLHDYLEEGDEPQQAA